MNEMIERAAFQIALEITELHGEQERGWKWPDDFPGDTIDRARSRARGVIAAMREPTSKMVDAAPPSHQIVNVGGTPYRFEALGGDPGSVWRAMIDAVLAEIPTIEQGR